jgi:hypothetical protein
MKAIVAIAVVALASVVLISSRLPYATDVVAKKTFLNQVGPIPTTTLYTPPKSGDFRVSIYLTSPSIGPQTGGSNVAVFVVPSWTDDSGTWPSQFIGVNGSCFLSYDLPSQSIPEQCGWSAIIHANANSAIQVKDGGSNDTVDMYSVFATVEKL